MRRGADSAIRDYVQPQIVGDIYDIDLLYIATEGSVICQLSKEKMLWCCHWGKLLGSFYISMFPIISQRQFWFFLEQALLEIGRGQTLVTISSFSITWQMPEKSSLLLKWFHIWISPCIYGWNPTHHFRASLRRVLRYFRFFLNLVCMTLKC